LSLPSVVHSSEFDYKRDTKHLWEMLKQSVRTHKLDFNFILRFLSSYNREQRIILVHGLEFEYGYKLIDIVLEQAESPIRSCTLALLIESIELYVRDFHDLILLKSMDKSNFDTSRKLVQILLALDNENTKKFKEIYKSIFKNSIETDIELVQGEKTIMSKLLIQLLEGQRNEEPTHSVSVAKIIATELLSEAHERSTPHIDYDTFIKIFTHDSFSQLSAIFDMYEDKYGLPIQVAIQNQCQGQIEAECFQDVVEYTRSPSGYHVKILRQALDKEPIDYITLIRTIIGHEGIDLCEIKLEYSKIYDETLDQTIENRIDIAEIKKLFLMIIAIGEEELTSNHIGEEELTSNHIGEEELTSNHIGEVPSDDTDISSQTSAVLSSTIWRVMGVKSNHALTSETH
jgi:hypothetical protein